MLICGVMMAVYSAPVTAAISILFLIIDIRIYLFLKSVFTKKKLVMTTRAKRLVFTSCILLAVLVALGEVCENIFHHVGGMAAALIGIFLTPYILMLANIINRPVEKAVRQYYINDAKKILKSNDHIRVIGITGSYGKTSLKFYLNKFPLTRIDYRRVAVLDIILRHLSFIDFLLLGKKVGSIFLLQQCCSLILLVL